MVVTVGEGGGLFMVERDGGKFLWAHPFPYDNPDLNMNEINPETGQTHVNVDKLFKKDGQTSSRLLPQHARAVVDRLSSRRRTRSTFRSRTSACR